MGVDIWRRRALDDVIDSSAEPVVARRASDAGAEPAIAHRAASALADVVAPVRVAPALEKAPRATHAPAKASIEAPAEALAKEARGDRPSFTGGWSEMRRAVSECSACDLHRTRTRTVFGVGDTSADWMLIGEAPGEQEDRQGEPFVGPAGQLLDAMLLAVGLSREQVYIANIIKCRPPGNRDPSPAESAHCRQWLERQIELVSPRVIMAVGGVAAKNLLGVEEPMWKLRGRVHRYRGIALVAGYHPAYLLRSPGEKRKAWQDLRLVMQVLESGR